MVEHFGCVMAAKKVGGSIPPFPNKIKDNKDKKWLRKESGL